MKVATRRLIAILLSLIMTFSFGACNKDKEENAKSTKTTTSQKSKDGKTTEESSTDKDAKTDEDTTTKDDKTSADKKSDTKSSNSSKSSDSKSSNSSSSNKSSSSNNSSSSTTAATYTDENDKLRKQLESTYGVTIYYGNENPDYEPGNGYYEITRLTDSGMITESLNSLKAGLSAYPSGFFYDFKNAGMPLTFLLIESAKYAGNTAWVGYADSEFPSNMVISLVYSTGGLSLTCHHEIMHCIDTYLEIKMYPQNPYDATKALNPSGLVYQKDDYNYTWPSAYEQYCYPNTNTSTTDPKLYFVSTYSLTSCREDRADTFRYMMRTSYIPTNVMNSTSITTQKADVISNQIKQYFPSASSGLPTWNKLHP